MIEQQQKTTHYSDHTKPKVTTKSTPVLNDRTVRALIENHICTRCYKKDPLIYPGSQFNQCLNCDKEKTFASKDQILSKTEDELISLGICPKCNEKDIILYSGSLFRTCIKCDAISSLRVTPVTSSASKKDVPLNTKMC